MIELPKKYAKPLAIGVVLVLASCVWAVGQPEAWRLREQDEMARHAMSLAKGMTVLVDGFHKHGPEHDSLVAQSIRDRLVLGGPMRFAQLRRGDVELVHVGEGEGQRWIEGVYDGGRLIVEVYQLGAERCDLMEPDEHPSPWSWCTSSDATAASHSLYVGMGAELPPHVRQEMERSVWSTLLLVWMSTVLLVWAWARSIRAGELHEQLAGEQRKLERLEEQNLAAAGLAHETKNPLGLILGLAQRLADDDSADPESRDVAEQIMDEADRANARLSDFLNFAGLRRPSLEEADVEQVCGRVVEALRGDFEAAGVHLESAWDEGTITCDVGMLEQVLVNLLLNSLSASGAGTTTCVRFEDTGGSGVLSVQDGGKGIPEEMLGEVFKPYITGRPDGHGLGLSVVRKIVEQHGWSVDVESEPGLGARFEVRGIEVGRRIG